MPWKSESLMDQRSRFVFEAELGSHPVSELCERYGISRKTGYKWLARFRQGGVEGLRDRSRTPQTVANRVPVWIEDLLIAERLKHPTWGPAKLLEIMRVQHGVENLPARSTAALILKRHGLSKPKRRRRNAKPKYHGPLTEPQGPNDVWTVDFKGWFYTKDGHKCFPLTICDLHSRYILCCQCQTGVTRKETKKNFDKIFEEFGLPKVIRVDNGAPFSSQALGGLSKLSLGWLKLDIMIDFIMPGRPDQNGAHERMHRTLKAEATIPPKHDMKAQQKRFDEWREEYNCIRPHEFLNMRPPGSQYVKSNKILPPEKPEFSYPSWYDKRIVRRGGYIKWQGGQTYIGEVFEKTAIGIRPEADDLFLVYAGPVVIGALTSDGSGGLRRPPEPSPKKQAGARKV